MTNFSKKFTPGLFWDVDVDMLHAVHDRNFIVHRILSYGTWEDIKRLVHFYSKAVVKKEFLHPKKGTYDPTVLKLCQHILGVRKIRKEQYVKTPL